MDKSEKVFDAIYMYYPINLEYDSRKYQESEQTLKRKSKIIKKVTSYKQRDSIIAELEQLLSKCKMIDWTEKDSCCYELKFLLHENQRILDDDIELIESLGGNRLDLRVFISVLAPYCYLFVEKTEYDFIMREWRFETVHLYSSETRKATESVENFIEKQGYKILSCQEARKKVENIETELKNGGQATVFDCLFSDMVSV